MTNGNPTPPVLFSGGSGETGREIDGGAVRGVAAGVRTLLSHAAILEDGKRNAVQLETSPSCYRAVEQSRLCTNLKVRVDLVQLRLHKTLIKFVS